MAYAVSKKGHIYIYSYYRDGVRHRKPRPLPRKETRHLDGLPQDRIHAFCQAYAIQFEGKSVNPSAIVYEGDDLNRYLEKWEEYLTTRLKRDESLARQMVSNIRRFAFGFFMSQNPPLRDPNQWPGVSQLLVHYLEEKNLRYNSIKAVNGNIRAFWKYLLEEKHVQTKQVLYLRSGVKAEGEDDTPLSFAITPDQVLDYVRAQTNTDLKLLALLGYFFSLRPQELFDLKRGDFQRGERAGDVECIRAMRRGELGTKLIVHVRRQKTNSGNSKGPKSDSYGQVACFDDRAADMIIDLIKDLSKDDPIFAFNNRAIYELWFQNELDISLKDLRRASIFWLGHESKMGEVPLHLKNHARHADFKTTMLYLRSPKDRNDQMYDDDLGTGTSTQAG